MKLIMLGILAGTTVVSVIGLSSVELDSPSSEWIEQFKVINERDHNHLVGGLQFIVPEVFAEITCESLDATGRSVKELSITGESIELPLGRGDTYQAMTFSQQVPGPTLRVTQGDIIKMRLDIPPEEWFGHSNDMHASQMNSQNFETIFPGQTTEYCFIAEVPGIFKYHCAGIELTEMERHVLSGMYGIVIVDPLHGYNELTVESTAVSGDGQIIIDRTAYDPEALEFQLVYSQLYLDDSGNFDFGAMIDHETTETTVNGMEFSYVPNESYNILVHGDIDQDMFYKQTWNELDLKQFQSQPLFVEEDQHVRLFIENVGNEPVFFHIIGEMLTRVVQGGRVQSNAIESWSVGGSQNAIIDVIFDEPGVYVAVNHDYSAIATGAMTMFVVGDPFNLNPALIEAGIIENPVPSYAYVFGNPSSAIPPMGPQSIPHPAMNIHGLMTDSVVEEMVESGNYIALWETMPSMIERLS